MRIFIAETFYEAIINLPKKIQKKVIEFQKKLRADSTTNGIHLEPIKQFKGDNMRSARVDDNYRAIVGVLNDAYHLLYVGSHDDAYDWGMRRTFKWNEYTQSAQFSVVINEERATRPAPAVSGPFASMEDGKMLQIGVPEDMLEQVKSLSSIDDLEKLEKYLPSDAFENIFNVLDGTSIDEVIEEIEAGKTSAGDDVLAADNNKRRFFELTDDEALQNIISQDMEKWQIFLHPSQNRLVKSNYKGTMKVSGGAGTGKTVVALHRLKNLCEKHDAQVLFTTYTRTLRDNLESLVGKMGVPKQRFTLMNIDQVVLDVCKKYEVKKDYRVLDYSGEDASLRLWGEVLETETSEFDEKFLYEEYVYVILYHEIKTPAEYMMQRRVGRSRGVTRKQRLAIWNLVQKYEALKEKRRVVDRLELFNAAAKFLNEKDVHPFTNVIADEFQDFSNPELRFLRALVKEGENDLFLTGDPLQRIYRGRKINFSEAGINVRGKRSHRLKINYRTTEQIKKAAVSVLEGREYDDLDGGKENLNGYVSLIRDGQKPTYDVLKDADEEFRIVAEKLATCKSGGIAWKDVCIAAPNSAILREVQTKLHHDGTPYKVLKGASAKGDASGVSLCTFHAIKGLEFKVVILIGVNARNVPACVTNDYPFDRMDAAEQKEYLTERRSLLYVALTRARQFAFVTGYGTPCEILNFQT